MKHVFSVHSPITFLVAYATIKHLKLEQSDVLIISSTYKVPIDDYRVIPSFAEAKNSSVLQKIKYFNVPKSFDTYLTPHLKREAFTAYVDLMSMFQRVLITHSKCQEFHFIEEGNSTYMSEDDLNDLTWEGLFRGVSFRVKNYFSTTFYQSLIRVLRGYNYRLLQMPFHYMAYANFKNTKYFCFSNNAFYNVSPDKRILLKLPKNDTNIQKLAGGHYLNDATIWLDGSNAGYTGLKESYYYNAIKKAIPLLKEKGIIKGKVHVKLRPGIKDISANKLVSILCENDLDIEVIPNDLILEAFFMQSNNCKIIGVLTSALEYAHVFGHEVYSIYGLFEKQPITFFDRMDGFWQNIENLKA